MNREDIIERMGWHKSADASMSDIVDRIEKIVQAAVHAEREACAEAVAVFGEVITHVIRARGDA